MDFEDPTGLANSIKELFTSVGSLSARKASELASQNEFNSNFEPLPPASVSSTSCQQIIQTWWNQGILGTTCDQKITI